MRRVSASELIPKILPKRSLKLISSGRNFEEKNEKFSMSLMFLMSFHGVVLQTSDVTFMGFIPFLSLCFLKVTECLDVASLVFHSICVARD